MGIVGRANQRSNARIEEHFIRNQHAKFEPKRKRFGLPIFLPKIQMVVHFLSLSKPPPLCFSSSCLTLLIFPFLIFLNSKLWDFAHWSSPLKMIGWTHPSHVVGSTKPTLGLQASNFSLGKHLIDMFDPFSLVCVSPNKIALIQDPHESNDI